MSTFVVEGGHRIKGKISPHGAKNSVLPILAASYLCDGEVVLKNCPDLTDVHNTVKILRSLGCKVKIEDHTAIINASDGIGTVIPDDLMRKMRSSVIFLGAIAAKCGEVEMTYPGGCELGARPIDLHLKALRSMGLKINEYRGSLRCCCKDKLEGTRITLDFPSVGATENIIIAASTAKGRTVIVNAAREPEIRDLSSFLRKCGAKIHGDGGSVIEVEGVSKLYGCEYTIMPDRIEAVTLLTAAAVNGELLLENVDCELIYPVISVLKECGCAFEFHDGFIYMKGTDHLHRINCVRTMPHPGFPTDAQAIIMAMCTIADGTSVFIENIFENRYRHVPELIRMGARIKTEGRAAVVEGVNALNASAVTASDLRGGAALVVAALYADGISEISNVHYIDRGYESLEKTLSLLGTRIKRICN